MATALPIALPAFQNSLGISLNFLQLVPVGYLFFSFCVLPLVGRLADRLGGKRVASLSGGVLLLGALIPIVMPNQYALLIGVCLLGICSAAIGVGILYITKSASFTKDPLTFYAYTQTINAVGQLGGFVVSGMLAYTFGWEWVFGVFVFLGVVTLLMIFICIPKLQASQIPQKSIDFKGFFLVNTSVLLLIGSFFTANKYGWSYIPLIGLGLALLLIVFSFFFQKEDSSYIDYKFFKIANIRSSMLLTFIVFFSRWTILFFLVIYLRNILGYEGLDITLLLVSCAVGIIVAQICVKKLSFPISYMRPIHYVFIALSLSLIIFASVQWSVHLVMFYMGFVLLGMGQGIGTPYTSSIVMGESERHGSAGSLASLKETVHRLGSILGMTIMVAVFNSIMKWKTTHFLKGFTDLSSEKLQALHDLVKTNFSKAIDTTSDPFLNQTHLDGLKALFTETLSIVFWMVLGLVILSWFFMRFKRPPLREES